MLLIKPSPESDYQNVVSLLDEALINDIKRYALIDLPAAEQAAVTIIVAKPSSLHPCCAGPEALFAPPCSIKQTPGPATAKLSPNKEKPV